VTDASVNQDRQDLKRPTTTSKSGIVPKIEPYIKCFVFKFLPAHTSAMAILKLFEKRIHKTKVTEIK
jgi:hypothetical protein